MEFDWNRAIAPLPSAHFLQTEQWALVKQSIGWIPHFVYWDRTGEMNLWREGLPTPSAVTAAALILERKINLGRVNTGLSMLYIPKGPLFDGGINSGKIILEHIKEFAQKRKAIYIKIDPDLVVGTGIEGLDSTPDNEGIAFRKSLQATGWRYSPDQVQFKNTVQLDLVSDIDDMLASMKPKTRYNIRLAEKKGVKIRPGTMKDLPQLYMMYAETALRDHFILRPEKYYLFTWELFMEKLMAEPLIAEVEGVPVAAVFIIRFAGKAWYVYGMSTQIHREKMPNHLLQWRAILRAKEVGCTCYDFWGAPSVFAESDPLWGVYKFKEGFGGQVVRTVGAWDFALKPTLYRITTIFLPKILEFLRRNARKQLSAASQL